MFTWWKPGLRKSELRYGASTPVRKCRPRLELLETRDCPSLVVGVGPTVNVSQAFGNQREQSIVVNPLNPNQVAAFSNIEDITGDGTSDDGIFEAWSTDGGLTWNTQYLFIDPNLVDASIGDPQAVWDNFGHIYLTYINVDTDVVVAKSIDGGQTFTTTIVTTDGAAGTSSHDQPSIAVGPGPQVGTEALWLSYESTPTGLPPDIEVTCSIILRPGVDGPFRTPVLVPGSDSVAGNFGDIAVGPNGQVVVTYQSSSGPQDGPSIIYANVDPDGMGPAKFSKRILVTSTNIGPARGPGNVPTVLFPAQTNNFGLDAEPNLAWDRSNGPHRGRLYMVYTDAPTILETDLNSNIFMRFSDDGGLTWSARKQVNDDRGGASQFNPAIVVDPFTGNLAMAWFDARNDPVNNTSAEVWATVSDDGGATLHANFKVSAGKSNVGLAEPASNGSRDLGYGDFNKIDFVKGNLQIVWSDNSPNLIGNPDPPHMDIATARVRVAPMLKVRIYFPVKWTVVDAAAGIYRGQITVVNLTGAPLTGPIRIQFNLDPAIGFLSPPSTRSGNTVTLTVNGNLLTTQPLRFTALISNPLHKPLPTLLTGFAAKVV